ncbi:MAG: TPM domain-containing protein [Nevskiales bacterium]
MKILGGLLLALVLGAAQAEVAVPALKARVTDLSGTLDEGQVSALEQRLAAFEQEKGSQIAVLILPTTQPEEIEQYGIRLAEAWKIGRKGVDDGVILLVAKDDRKLRIEVGYGLEGALPDVIAKRIIEEVIVPRFRAGDFYGGITDGVERIIGVIKGEPLPESAAAPFRTDLGGFFMTAVIVTMVIGSIITQLFGRLAGGSLTGSAAGVATWALSKSLMLGLFAGIVFALIVMTMRNRGRGGWASGGGGSGGGGSWSGGGGGGGFSGGGGSFGGGGASGGW